MNLASILVTGFKLVFFSPDNLELLSSSLLGGGNIGDNQQHVVDAL